MIKIKTAYPILISESTDHRALIVYVPDLKINTEGKNLLDAIEMARDAISLWIVDREDVKKEIPIPSKTINKKEAEDIITFVDVDTDAYRREIENKAVRKNLTIPSWLNEKAEKQGLNFSNVLQKALKHELGIKEEL
ncbi:MAG: type II toxin-antitoxin system HicB family antitoxin [Oscillospiraceae bacterium]|nr:type II toxin-antitoxin system HicB family antitoxin [Oscillospiraceae bacterium]